MQLAGDIHFAIGSGGSRANMLLESMPGGVDGLPDIGLPLRLNDQLFFSLLCLLCPFLAIVLGKFLSNDALASSSKLRKKEKEKYLV